MVADTLFRFLHFGESRVVDADSDHGARPGAANPGQRYRPRAHPTEPPADAGSVRSTVRIDAVAPRHQPPRDRGGHALHPGGAGHDRPDDRTRWRAAPRLGTTSTVFAGRVESEFCSKWDARHELA